MEFKMINICDIPHNDSFDIISFTNIDHTVSIMTGYDGHYFWNAIHAPSDDDSSIIRSEPYIDDNGNADFYYDIYSHHFNSEPGSAEEVKEFAKLIKGVKLDSDYDMKLDIIDPNQKTNR